MKEYGALKFMLLKQYRAPISEYFKEETPLIFFFLTAENSQQIIVLLELEAETLTLTACTQISV